MATYRDLLTVIKDHQYAYSEEDDEGVYFSCKCGTDELQDEEDEPDMGEWHAVHLAGEIEEALELDLVP